MTPCQILRATECSATPHPILAKSLIRVQYYVAKFFMAYHMILGVYLVQVHYHAAKYFAMSLYQVQDHAAKFSSMPCTITHAIKSFVTETPHVLKIIAIESQKLISTTSDVVDTKVITTGEPTTPSLLVTALPSINNFFAGDSHAHDLLRAQPATTQHILHESVGWGDIFEHSQLHYNISYMHWLIWISSILAMTKSTSLVSCLQHHLRTLLCTTNFVLGL